MEENAPQYIENATSSLIALPDDYDRLMGIYLEILQQQPFNPYDMSSKAFLKFFSSDYRHRIGKLPFHAHFTKVPNTLSQELLGAGEMLK